MKKLGRFIAAFRVSIRDPKILRIGGEYWPFAGLRSWHQATFALWLHNLGPAQSWLLQLLWWVLRFLPGIHKWCWNVIGNIHIWTVVQIRLRFEMFFFRWSKSDSGWFRSIFIHFFEFDKKKMDIPWYPQSWCLENRFVFFHVFVHVFFQKETGHFGGTPLGAPGRGTPSHLLLVAWWIWAMKIPLALSHLIILVAGWWWLEHWFSMG